jgi:hypothetical protein
VLLGKDVMTRGRRDVIAARIEDRRRQRFERAAFSGISSEEKSRLLHALVHSRGSIFSADLDDDDGATPDPAPGEVDVQMLARVALACLPPSVARPSASASADPLEILGDIMTRHRNRSITAKVKEFLGRRYVLVADNEPAAQLESLRGGARVTAPRSPDRLDEVAAQLFDEMPWQRAAISALWKAARERAGSETPLPPILLYGEKGWGKSTVARRFAELCGRPHVVLDCASAGAALRIAGTEKGWGSACPGVPIETILRQNVADPVFVLDEIDKAGRISSMSGSVSSMQNALLPLLEPGTARDWNCPYFRRNFNMSRISWILTANYLEMVPEPLRDRCVHVECPRPKNTDIRHAALIIAQKHGVQDPEMVADVVGKSISTTGISLRGIERMILRIKSEDERPMLN